MAAIKIYEFLDERFPNFVNFCCGNSRNGSDSDSNNDHNRNDSDADHLYYNHDLAMRINRSIRRILNNDNEWDNFIINMFHSHNSDDHTDGSFQFYLQPILSQTAPPCLSLSSKPVAMKMSDHRYRPLRRYRQRLDTIVEQMEIDQIL
ncbi:hypothetical protein DERP_005901 [Dermatophagoides pteronyssinus]|nr:hypothetical protein DERP_005901 [Dermatophagoides pteronyssinus]